jgi:hypothetical protein
MLKLLPALGVQETVAKINGDDTRNYQVDHELHQEHANKAHDCVSSSALNTILIGMDMSSD